MIEESMLATLQIKRDLAAAALDPESGVDVVRMGGGIEALKTRVRTLLDWKPATACGRGTGSVETRTERLGGLDPGRETPAFERTPERSSSAGEGGPPSSPDVPVQAAGRLMSAMFEFMRALDPGLSVPDETALSDLAAALARAFQKGVRS